MEMLTNLFDNLGVGFATALSGQGLLLGISGVVLGTAVGVLPGLGPAVSISLLLPFTFGLDPISAFILFGGIYYGAMYGGATTAILVNTPGCSASAVSTFDGYPMARSGRAGTALAAAAIGSFFGGTFATLMMMLLAPILVEVALLFGPPEYFSLMLMALTMVSAIAGESAAKAAFATFLGLGISMIGIDLQTGAARFTFGIPELFSGVNVVLAGIGLFAVGEGIWVLSSDDKSGSAITAHGSKLWMSASEWLRALKAWSRGTLLGFFAGVLPGSGGTLATFMSYGIEKSLSKHPEEFGKGAIEGIAGPEAANNAAAGGSMVPLLALGIPGSATTAVMLAAFQQYGIQPGPLLFAESPDLVWALIASLYIANILLVVLNLPLVGVWARLLKLPQEILYGSVLVLSMVGAYTMKGSLGDVVIVTILGALAFALRKLKVPVAPVLLGLVLGPMIEQAFRRSMTLSAGDATIFFDRPLSLSFLMLAAVSIGAAVYSHFKKIRLEAATE